MSKENVAAIIVNWRLKEDTVKSIRSLNRSEMPTSIIVVDNGSNDGSAEYIARHFPEVELLTLKSNRGFAFACNLALSYVLKEKKHDFIFFLNNDATVNPDTLSELIGASRQHPHCGIFGPKVYYSDRPDTIWYAGARRIQGVLAVTHTARGRLDFGQFEKCHEVDYVFAAAMLVRREVFEKTGLFDSRFFLYLEDLDLCLRAQKAGFSLLFVPTAKVWHKGSASTSRNIARRRFHMAKSTVHFLKKHTPAISRLPIFVFWVLIYFKDIFGDLIQGDTTIVKSCWSGFFRGILGKNRIS